MVFVASISVLSPKLSVALDYIRKLSDKGHRRLFVVLLTTGETDSPWSGWIPARCLWDHPHIFLFTYQYWFSNSDYRSTSTTYLFRPVDSDLYAVVSHALLTHPSALYGCETNITVCFPAVPVVSQGLPCFTSDRHPFGGTQSAVIANVGHYMTISRFLNASHWRDRPFPKILSSQVPFALQKWF